MNEIWCVRYWSYCILDHIYVNVADRTLSAVSCKIPIFSSINGIDDVGNMQLADSRTCFKLFYSSHEN